MLKKTGIVIDLKKKTAIVMLKNFDFYEVKRKPSMLVGQTIIFSSGRFYNYNGKRESKVLKVIGFTATFLIIILFIIYFYLEYKYF
ncbi:anti-sigma factor domain-containing protein [Herbivorax sp. ANBcel31]|uniref:anti-sigma factor domain-containing protein n=1 Tax=Herbivorax sp. ANBcel31 TaxID=3069754 RepID=UPI0027B53DCD|nr:anti-sigma factor domain-containing protein [Herbivorax sp. ANBcel31]MDQ2086396.1 anti-sigma factor domain-containing protein [Herbivorax sp. ANBcel31]